MEDEELLFDPSQLHSDDEPAKADEKNESELDLFNNDILSPQEKTTSTDEVNEGDDQGENKEGTPPQETDDFISVVLGEDLSERGVISNFEKEEILKVANEEGDAAALRLMLEKQVEVNNNQLKDSYDNDYKEYLNMVQGGVSKEEATEISKLENFYEGAKGKDLKGEDDDSAQARKDVLTLNYRMTTQFSEDRIKKLVDRSYEDGDDLDEVDEALSNIEAYISNQKTTAINEAKEAENKAKESQQALIDNYKANIDKADEFFKDEKINDVTKVAMNKLINEPVKLNDGTITNGMWAERAKDPVLFDTKLAYLVSSGYFKNEPFDLINKNITTKETSKLNTFLQDNKNRNFGSSRRGSFSKNSSEVNLLDV